MTQQALDGQVGEQPTRRGRGSSKSFPMMNFEDVLILPQAIIEHSANGRLRRKTLFDRLGESPEGRRSRQMITAASRYGLTSGGHNAEYITVTETGAKILESGQTEDVVLTKKFECAIGNFEVFHRTYETLVSKRVPADDVLTDLFRQAGLQSSDLEAATSVFVANLRYLGLIQQASGDERIISIDQLLEELSTSTKESPPEPRVTESQSDTYTAVGGNGKASVETNRPDLHIDIQVHIDATASAEQIDFIFASMAKHLYGRES